MHYASMLAAADQAWQHTISRTGQAFTTPDVAPRYLVSPEHIMQAASMQSAAAQAQQDVDHILSLSVHNMLHAYWHNQEL